MTINDYAIGLCIFYIKAFIIVLALIPYNISYQLSTFPLPRYVGKNNPFLELDEFLDSFTKSHTWFNLMLLSLSCLLSV